MAALSSIKQRQDEASARIVRALGITLPQRQNNVSFPADFHLAEILNAIADAVEVNEPQELPK